jgi:uncharacterized protein (DUF4415 family)
MKLKNTLTAAALCCSIFALGTAAVAAPDSPFVDAVIMADEAAEAEAEAAEAVAESQAEQLKKDAAIEMDAVRGEPMQETLIGGEQ